MPAYWALVGGKNAAGGLELRLGNEKNFIGYAMA